VLGDFTNPVDLMILVGLALVVFGPNRLVEMSRKLGPTLHELRTMNQQLREQAGLDEATRALQDIRSGLSFSTPPDAGMTPRSSFPSATARTWALPTHPRRLPRLARRRRSSRSDASSAA